MSRIRLHPRDALQIVARLLLGGLYLYAGLSKAFSHQDMVLAVNSYDVLPVGTVEAVAWILPWLEILLGVSLLVGLFVRFSAAGLAALTLVFIAGLSQAKARGLAIDCGCFGGGGPGEGVGWSEILRDIGLLIPALYLVWWPRGALQLDNAILDVEDMEDDG